MKDTIEIIVAAVAFVGGIVYLVVKDRKKAIAQIAIILFLSALLGFLEFKKWNSIWVVVAFLGAAVGSVIVMAIYKGKLQKTASNDASRGKRREASKKE